MASIRVTMPAMLATLVGGDRRFDVDGETVDGVLEAVFARHPELRVHVVDERGEIRPHVTVFVNDRQVVERDIPVADGDECTILQAVSGGSPEG